MKRWAMIAGAALTAGLLGSVLTAAPPADASGGVGCVGANCSVSIYHFIHLSGTAGYYDSGGAGNVSQILLPTPPCLWNQIGDATTGSQYIIDTFPNPAGLPFEIPQAVTQAKQLLKNPDPGRGQWYNLPINPAAGPAGQAACLALPAFVFVPTGGAPPMPPLPPGYLARYAYNSMTVPPVTVTTSPANQGWVNLATFVWTHVRRRVISVTATLGTQSETVTATAARPVITVNGAGQPFDSNCLLSGSHYSPGNIQSGPGTPPDCGVLWTEASTGATITVTMVWHVTWGPGDHTLPDITQTGSKTEPVQQIQSINNGG